MGRVTGPKSEQLYRYRYTEKSGKQRLISVYARNIKDARVRADIKAGHAGIMPFECKVEAI